MTFSSNDQPPDVIATPAGWIRLAVGLVLVFGLLQWSASALGSDRGQAGVLVGAIVVVATASVERWGFGHRPVTRALGLSAPASRGLGAAAAVGLLLVAVVPMFAFITGASVSLYPGWKWLVAGLFAQAGVAEEILFRGYLFGHLRRGRPFGRAATLSMLPFVAVHLFLFFTMEWPIALAAVLLATILSWPLAHLFELGGRTIWAPALLHFVIQGTIKIFVLSGGGSASFPLVWMAACAVLPLLVLRVRARP